MAHCPHVQGAAEPDDKVRPGDQLRGQRGGEPAGYAQVELVLVEKSLGHGGGRHQGAGVLGEGQDLRPGLAPAAARDEHRALRRGEQPGQLLHRGTRGTDGFGEGDGCRQPGLRLGDLLRLDVQRKVQHHRAAVVHRAAVGPHGVGHGAGCGVHPLGHRVDGGGKAVLVHREVRVDGRGRGLRGQDDHRGAGLGGLADAGCGVGQPAALVHREQRDLAAGAREGVGHRCRAALVAGRGERDALFDQRVGDGEVPGAHHAEAVADAEFGKGLAHKLRDVHVQLFPTMASTRVGAPVPPTIGSGATTTIAPCVGSLSRFFSEVIPYLSAPSRK